MGEGQEEIRRAIARSFRRARGAMSKTALAQLVGVNMTTISRWEDEENPSPPTLDRAIQVAEALGLSLEELVYGQATVYQRALAQARSELEAQFRLLREELQRELGGQQQPPAGRPR